MKRLLKFFENKQILALMILSFVLNFLVEILARKSLLLGLRHMIFHAPVFFYNVLLILSTLSISLLFKRRYFAIFIITLVWIALGISNFVIVIFRTIPLSAIDFTILKSGIKIMPMYFNSLQIILLIIAAFAVIAFIIFAWIRLPKLERKISKQSPSIAIIILSFALSTVVFIQSGILSNNFKNLIDANYQYGFAYCFSRALFDRGVSKPKDYSKDVIDGIISDIKTEDRDSTNEINDDISQRNQISEESDRELEKLEKLQSGKPNIIFLQLESFYDVNYMKGIIYSKNPIPVFTHLKSRYSSGFLNVTSIGAGTANTEFEVLTGMSLEFFGAGEYPYTTILKESTCETINFNLKELMYKTHAIHNHTATFYDRNKVYSQLGFDSFTPVECMSNVEYNEIGWAKDKVLINEIVKTLKSSKGKDFIYTISVQGHGKYPSKPLILEPNITLSVDDVSSLDSQNGGDTNNSESGSSNDDSLLSDKEIITNEDIIEYANEIKIPFEYYVNQINEMDKFIGGLISTLNTINEPVVLVIFGDHLPAFEIKKDYLKNNDIFQTEYIIWDNLGLEKEDENLNAYQLTSAVLNKLDITNGILTKFHEINKNSDNYKAELEMLEHDMLYGEKEAYSGVNPYTPTDMKYGVDDISIKSASVMENSLYVIGSNFTKWSNIYVNGNKQNTKFVNNILLTTDSNDLKPGDIITVCLIADDGTLLETSAEYEFK